MDIPRAVCGSADRPLKIGEALEDGRRMLVQRGLQKGVGMSEGGGHGGAPRIAEFLSRIESKVRHHKEESVRQNLAQKIPIFPAAITTPAICARGTR